MSPFARLRRLEPIEKTAMKLGAFGAICLVVIVALVVAVLALSTAKNSKTTADTANAAAGQANVSIASQCEFYYGAALASGPTLPTPVTKVGLAILVGARQAYEGLGCDIGPIPDPAPQVKAALPPGVH